MALEVVKIREFSGHTQAVYGLCKGNDDLSFYSGAADGMLVKWQVDSDDGLLIARHSSALYTLFSDQNFLIAGSRDGSLLVYDFKTLGLKQLHLGNSPLYQIHSFLEWYLILNGKGEITVLNHQFEILRSVKVSDRPLRSICSLGDGVAVAGTDSKIYILDTDLNLKFTIEVHSDTVFALEYQMASDTLFSAGKDVVLRSYKGFKPGHAVTAHLLHIHSLALNHYNGLLLSSSMDKHIKVWNSSDLELLKVVSFEKQGGHLSSVNKILWFDKNNFISCSDDRTLKCFEIKQEK